MFSKQLFNVVNQKMKGGFMPLEDYKEYVVSGISGNSSSPGNPDKIANMVLEKWGLVPEGDNPGDRLFEAAVPASRFVGAYRLKVLEQGESFQAWLHGPLEDEMNAKLDFGPVLKDESDLAGEVKKFVLEGNILPELTILCKPVLQEPAHDEEVVTESVPSVNETQAVTESAMTAVIIPTSTAVLCDIPVSSIRRNKDQPRKIFKPGDLLLLGKSMKNDGQKTRIDVIRVEGDPNAQFELVRGERRWRSAQLVGIKVLRATVLSEEEIPNKDAQHRTCLISDLHNSRYGDVELAFALAREQATGSSLQELATMCNRKSIAWVQQHLAITQLAPELLALVDPNLPNNQRMSFSIACRIAKLLPIDQIRVWGIVSKIKGAKLQSIETDKLVAIEKGGSRRSAADHYKNLRVMVPRVLGDTSIAEGYPSDVFLSLVQHRPLDEVELLKTQIEDAIKHLKAIQTRITQAQTKWKECDAI
jgi:ParB/RepB/Spo0J family partition protein